jgi:hypothetical protein
VSSAGSHGHAEIPGLSPLAVNEGQNESLLAVVVGVHEFNRKVMQLSRKYFLRVFHEK